MRSLADRAAAALVVLALAGCTDAPASTGSPDPTVISAGGGGPANRDPRPSPSPKGSPAAIELPEPGHPFDASSLLREMQGSTRPGGVPDAVQTPAIAETIAATVWTLDGSSWDTMAISGYCGSTGCTVELAGARIGQAGDDQWILEVNPTTGAVTVVAAELRALPWELVDALDVMARQADASGELDPMLLATARWLPPPDGERFMLSYRSGGEEGSCAREVTVDAARGAVIETASSGC